MIVMVSFSPIARSKRCAKEGEIVKKLAISVMYQGVIAGNLAAFKLICFDKERYEKRWDIPDGAIESAPSVRTGL
jgi:hypothetical protein